MFYIHDTNKNILLVSFYIDAQIASYHGYSFVMKIFHKINNRKRNK